MSPAADGVPCGVCGRPLRSPKSIARGYGERCAPEQHAAAAGSGAPAPDMGAAPPGPLDVAIPKLAVKSAPGQLQLDAEPAPAPQEVTTSTDLQPEPSPSPPARLITAHVTVDYRHRYEDDDPTTPTAIGYDHGTRRIEVQIATGQTLAYRNISPDLHRQLMINGGAEQPNEMLYETRSELTPETLQRDAYRYADHDEAEAAGIRSHCPVCGEFTGAGHLCRGGPEHDTYVPVESLPEDAEQMTLSLTGDDPERPILLRTYDPDQILDTAAASPYGVVRAPVRALVPTAGADTYPRHDDGRALAEGTLDITVDGTHLIIASDELRCDCVTYRRHGSCRHTREVIGRFRTALAQRLEQQNETYAQLLQRAAEPEPAEAPVDQSTFSYSDDPERFTQTVIDALDRSEEERVLFIDGGHEPAMYGYGADREFGVELEFQISHQAPEWRSHPSDEELPSAEWTVVTEETLGLYDKKIEKPDGTRFVVRELGWHDEEVDRLQFDDEDEPDIDAVVLERVVHGLNEQNLSSADSVEMHGDTARSGYTRDIYGGWTIELDPTVDGAEVISPVMSDTRSSWRTLQIACDTIKTAGGTAGANAGSHVTVSARDFIDSPSRMTRLFNVLHHYNHELETLSCAGHGRGDYYAESLPETPPMGWVSIDEAQDHTDRYRVVNIKNIPSSTADLDDEEARIEFRRWDSTLDPGTIQAQIKVSSAILDFVSAGGNADPDEGIYMARRAQDPRKEPEAFAEATAPIRRLIDTLFHRDIDKIQAATLWASGARRRFGGWL